VKGSAIYLVGLVPALVSAQKPVSVKDYSDLYVVVNDARLLVIDPDGKRTGLDTASGQEIREILHASVAVDAIDDDVTGEPAKSVSVTVQIQPAVEGTYRIILVGAGGKACGTLECMPSDIFELAVDAFAVDGSPQPAIRVPVDLRKTPRVQFWLHLLKTPGSTSRLERISAAER
jgi:hypothetical protein